MSKMDLINNNNEYTLDCSNIFLDDIELLKQWRDILWTSQETSAFLVRDYVGYIPELMEQRTRFKDHVSDDLYRRFETEHYMTIYLLEKYLIKAYKEDILPRSEEDKKLVKECLEKIATIKEKMPKEEILNALKNEDPSIRKALERINLPKEKIQEAIAKGFKVESVLDIEEDSYTL